VKPSAQASILLTVISNDCPWYALDLLARAVENPRRLLTARLSSWKRAEMILGCRMLPGPQRKAGEGPPFAATRTLRLNVTEC
jgi:hypothetical protein